MKGGDPMSNLDKGGMPEDLMRIFIAESLEKLPPETIKLICRITMVSMSGR